RSRAGVVVVVAGRRVRASLVPAPGGIIAVLVVGERPVRIGGISDGEHRAGDRVEDGGRGRGIGGGAPGNVASTDERDRRRHGHGKGARARPAVLVRDRDEDGVGTGRTVGVRGRYSARLAAGAPGRQRRAVAPVDRV